MTFRKLIVLLAIALAPALPAFAGPAAPDHRALAARSLAVIEAQVVAFRDTARTLAQTTAATCAGSDTLEHARADLAATWRAWVALDAYQFGPIEQQGAILSVDFWPDRKGYVGKGLKALLALPPEDLAKPETFANASAAVQGLPAIERLLYGSPPPCPAVSGISAHLRKTAEALHEGWVGADGWATLMRNPGPENPAYASPQEVTAALFTALDLGFSRVAEQRLGLPLGSFDKPRPRLAEARTSGQSLALIDAQLAALSRLLEDGFAPALPDTLRAGLEQDIAAVRARIGKIGMPLDAAVSDPLSRIRVEDLATRLEALRGRLAREVGPALGVVSGFTAADGD